LDKSTKKSLYLIALHELEPVLEKLMSDNMYF